MRPLGLLLLALALPPAVYYNTLGARRAEQWERNHSELRALTTRLEQAQAAHRKLSQFHEEVTRLGEELVKLRVILPPVMQIEDVRAITEAEAGANGVRMTKFETGGLKPASTLQQQAVEAEVIGSAEGTSQFFRDIANTSRIIDVTDVTLRPDPGGWRTNFVMTAYAMPD